MRRLSRLAPLPLFALIGIAGLRAADLPASARATQPGVTDDGEAEFQRALAKFHAQTGDILMTEYISLLRSAVNKGHPPALTELGHARLRGLGIPANPREAMDCFAQAAAQGDTAALFWLGAIRFYGIAPDIAADTAAGLKHLRDAAAKNDAQALTLLADIITSRPLLPEPADLNADYAARAKAATRKMPQAEQLRRDTHLDALLKLAAERGSAMAANDLGDRLKSPADAPLYDLADRLGEPRAAYRKAYRNPRRVKSAEEKAAYKAALEAAMDKGSILAATTLAYGHSPESSVPLFDTDPAAWRRYTRRAAELGDAQSCGVAADFLLIDGASPADREAGRRHLRFAVAHLRTDHLSTATLALAARMVLIGELPDVDTGALRAQLESRARECPVELGEFQSRGIGGPKDPKAALATWEKGEPSHRHCRLRAAEAYSFGDGTPRDDAKAWDLLESLIGSTEGKARRPSALSDAKARLIAETGARHARRLETSADLTHRILAARIYACNGIVPADYAKAGRMFLDLAESGDPAAKLALAEWYGNGNNPSADHDKNRTMLLALAEAGYAPGCAVVIKQGLASRLPPGQQTRWARIAAESGDTEVAGTYGMRLYDGIGTPVNKPEAARWLLRHLAGKRTKSSVELYLTLMRLSGDGLPRDDATALKLLKSRAPNGFEWAAILYGDKLMRGDGVPQDQPGAIAVYKRYTDLNRRACWAQLRLAEAYLAGAGVPRSPQLAAKAFAAIMSADDYRRQSLARTRPANSYIADDFVLEDALIRADAAAAAKHIRAMADAGDTAAAGIVAQLLSHGLGVAVDTDAADKYAAIAAEAGDPGAMYAEALRQNDPAKAAPLLKRAADLGLPPAALRYGLALHLGEGVPENPTEAVRYFRLAADAGDADARCRLGECHAAGTGAPKDEAEAVRLWKSNLKTPHELSLLLLADAYEHGRGVPADPVEAAALWRRLNTNGFRHPEAETFKNRLTPEQQTAAEKRFWEMLGAENN